MKTRTRILVVGAGGFAREVVWLIHEINRSSPAFEFVGFVVSDLSRLSEHDSVDTVRGDFNWLAENQGSVDAAVIGIGSPAARISIGEQITREFPSIEMPPLIHPNVRFDEGSCRFGKGTLLCAGTMATVNVVLDDFAMVNLSCTLGHECVVGRGSVLNPTVNISGGVTIKEGVLVGTGSQILQYVTIGERATIGAGAVVTKSVDAGLTVVGAPAKPLERR